MELQKRNSNNGMLLALMLTIIIDVMGFTLIFPLLPALFVSGHAVLVSSHTALATRYAYYSIALSLWPVGAFFGTPYLGQLSDKFGRKRILTVCLLITCTSYICYAISIYAHSIQLFLITRFLAGFFGGNYDIAQAATADISSQDLKMRNMGWITVAAAIGMVIGPAIASFTATNTIVPWFSIVTPFWIAAILAMINVVLVMLLLKETYAVKRTSNILLSKIFSAFLFVFIDKRVIRLGLTFFLLNLGWVLYLTAMPLVLEQIFHFSIQFMGLFFCVLGIGSIFAILFIQPKLTKKLALKHIYITTAVIAVMFLIASDIMPNLKELWICVFAFAILQVLCFSSLLAMCSNAVTSGEQGKIMGGIGGITSISSFFACILLAWLTHFGVFFPLLVAAGAFLLSSLLMFRFQNKEAQYA